jgi:sorbitol-6-phosphate 2-dehydrogenase
MTDALDAPVDAAILAIAPVLRARCSGPGRGIVTWWPELDAEPDPATLRVELDVTTEPDLPGRLLEAIAAHEAATGAPPGRVVVSGAGTFTVQPAPAAGPGPVGRLAGRVALVTGAAQGFGLGIAEGLLAHGATVVLADLNVPLAEREADRLAVEHGEGRAVAIRMDVTDEASVAQGVLEAVRRFGGFDLVVSNAGVLRAGGVTSQPVDEFDLVTRVNYRGYWLVVKHTAPVLARQHAANPAWWGDIVEISSKSGLVGSSRNSAYAGSKFGGIGLTQSFALELVGDGIKVNAVCPGNYFDGPLWSDPVNGLFVQYLREGKVPGALTVDDVRHAYEAKVPMGRGCVPADITEAILYLVAQQYETGQALPVTGGQVMLS